ncbi:MAG: helix-turn-helix domain-containing protein [Burkholderiaceae bacterium]|jgi:Fis family transcriptional regulator|nr:Nitrogen assimilation regulatory protein [Betaproteobacteria bacterium MOLA814]|tara:strand:- start:133 stop:369 length:237 start_codon:yes stop_codon:yes gene_type:complete
MSRPDLETNVRHSMQAYFADLGDNVPCGVYDMVINVVEKPLLQEVMTRTNNNQSLAAQWLGLNRNTLRKKLLQHKLID